MQRPLVGGDISTNFTDRRIWPLGAREVDQEAFRADRRAVVARTAAGTPDARGHRGTGWTTSPAGLGKDEDLQ